MKYLDQVDSLAAEIGAVNTIVNHHGILQGHNTDCVGAVRALTEKTAIKDKTVALIGAGGAARAVGFGIMQEGGRLTVINRTRQSGESLAADLNCQFKLLSDIKRLSCQIVINATSIGMTPHEDSTPLRSDFLENGMTVMDLVYNPLDTWFLREARKKGCVVVDGMAMFVHQGAAQFELWTGQTAPVAVMRQAVLDELNDRN